MLKRQILFLSFTLTTIFIFYFRRIIMQYVSNISLIISHFGICLGIVQNVFLLNWDILIISQYYMYVIKFRSTSQIIHLFYLFHVSFDCVYWFSWYPGWYSYATTQNDINMRMIRLELGKTFVYLLHQWPILFSELNIERYHFSVRYFMMKHFCVRKLIQPRRGRN